jgi:acyl-CoA thioesterase I
MDIDEGGRSKVVGAAPRPSSHDSVLLALVALLALAACSRQSAAPEASSSSAGAAARPVVLCLGTSLTAGLGLDDPDQAYPALLQQKVDAAGLPHEVRNAGVSGETSAGALSRLDWLLQQKIAVLVLETGANDALRGQDPESTRGNISTILKRVAALNPRPRVLLLGMQAPPNMGPLYAARFRAIFPDLAREHDAVLVPFFLEGVAGHPGLNQADGVHPTAEGQKKMAETIWPELEPLLK